MTKGEGIYKVEVKNGWTEGISNIEQGISNDEGENKEEFRQAVLGY